MSSDSPEPSSANVRVQWGVRIRMRDGVHLSATLYLPSDSLAPSPAIVTLTPYVAQSYHWRGMYFASRGFPFLIVDVRGRGNSEGEFRPFIQEATDGYDVVEWLASQPYCNGKVAMWGGSYSGYAQWVTAARSPPHLSAIVPSASPYIGGDFPMRNNIVSCYVMQWLTLVSGRTSQEKIFAERSFWTGKFRQWFEAGAPFKELDALIGNSSEVFREWLAHPRNCEYWDQYNPTPEQYASIELPTLTITGIYDGDQQGALMHYRAHQQCASGAWNSHYLIIGPWDHPGTALPKAEFGGLKVEHARLLDLAQLHLQWYAWTLQGGPKPSFLRKNVACYVMGAEKWRYADSLQELTARHVPLSLGSASNATDVLRSGWMAEDPSSSGESDEYIYDPRDLSCAELEESSDTESWVDQRMLYASVGKVLIYHSAPFKRDTEISGFFRLTAWISIDQPDTDFRVSIHEVTLEGASVLLTSDSLRARYRTSLREATLVSTCAPLCYDFQRFNFASRLVRKGHRLRLVIGPINSIYSQKNYNCDSEVSEQSTADARPVTVRLFHSAAWPSVLHVPFGQLERADV